MYVRVIILFCTNSRRYSTDMPWPSWGLTAPVNDDPTLSECNDWASHSRGGGGRGADDVGVVPFPAAVNDIGLLAPPFEPGTAKDGGMPAGIDAFDAEFDLNCERRFWADDLRCICGRGLSEKWDIGD